MIANQMAITIEKNLLVDELILTTIIGLARLVEAKDSDTGMHLERMQNYSRVIATTLRRIDKYKSIIDNQFINDIFKFSPLHDIGKVGIADGILLKPAKLTPEEFEVMKKHTIIGAEVLRKASTNLLQNGRHFFDMGIEIALSHHEKYNGKGYPYGLSGGAIPLSARIVTVADVFDALTSKRVYKRAMDLDFSLQMITDESGKSFDPDIVEALLNSKEQILEIYEKYHESIDIDRR
jgi:response regulator RpfG family c-di-GMP phosphodiesterase